MDEITLDGKTYVSSKRAALITGYAKDYVGQLCREGRVEARLVGRNWYILESSIREHRFGAELKKEAAKDENGVWKSPSYAAESISALPIVDASQKIIYEMPAGERKGPERSDTVQEMQNAWEDWFSITRKNDQIPTTLEEDLFESSEIIEDREESISETVAEPEEAEAEEIVTLHPLETVHLVKIVQEPVAEVVDEPEYKAQNVFTDVSQDNEEEIVPLHRSYIARGLPTPAVLSSPTIHQPRYTPQEPTYGSPRPEGRILHESRVQKKKKASVALQALFLTIAGIAIAIALIGSGKADTFLQQNRIQYGPINFLGGETVVNKVNK